MLRMTQTPLRSIATVALWACAGTPFAHDGHSLHGSHWHATDLWGFVALGLVLAVAVWQGRK